MSLKLSSFPTLLRGEQTLSVLQPEVWPYRVGVRRFIPKRPRNDWASQSANSGGNIQRDTAGYYSHGRHFLAGFIIKTKYNVLLYLCLVLTYISVRLTVLCLSQGGVSDVKYEIQSALI